MARTNQALKVAMAAVEQLPVSLQRQLAEQVLSTVASDDLLLVPLQRLTNTEQSRLQTLMDKNNDGLLTKAERLELEKLGKRVDEMMLVNSKLLAMATRPDLFDENGNPIKRRIQAAMRASTKKTSRKRKAENQ